MKVWPNRCRGAVLPHESSSRTIRLFLKVPQPTRIANTPTGARIYADVITSSTLNPRGDANVGIYSHENQRREGNYMHNLFLAHP